MAKTHSVSLINKALKEVGTHGHVIEVPIADIDRSKAAREARRAEYNGLTSLPFYSREQAERLRILEIEVVADNHVAMNEDINRRNETNTLER